MSKKSKKEVGTGLSGFAITAIGLGLLFRPITMIKVAIIAAISFAVGKAVGVMSTGLDLTTHNRQDRQPEKEYEELGTSQTGDANADAVIAKGKEYLEAIRAANNAIPDADVTRKLYQLENKCVQIFKTVEDRPAKAGQIRKFMNYYLPTTLKMLNSYRTMQDRGISYGEMARAKETLHRGMDMVLTACQKQLDNLYKDTMLDVSTDIDVLEQMLKRDGFAEGDFSRETINARTAASAQWEEDGDVPTLRVSEDNNDTFQSYYQQKSQRN